MPQFIPKKEIQIGKTYAIDGETLFILNALTYELKHVYMNPGDIAAKIESKVLNRIKEMTEQVDQ